MKKIFQFRYFWQIAAASLIAGVFAVNAVIATTTIGNDITTEGTLTTAKAVVANASSTLASFGSGGTTISKFLYGTCTVTINAVAASSTAVSTCTATGVTTDYKVFVTPYISNPSIMLTSASSTADDTIQIAVYNTGWVAGVPGVSVNPADNSWSWMAIK